jgi:alkanesulfonate monooxygenase SsuD/methylene tetrahydromethanopterin reductase-like flavin-dependent oxidoreductase (luciferase family)
LQRVKEYIAIIRTILAREAPLTFNGDQYTIPYAGADATGLGRPLRSIAHGDPNVPFYTASITPAGLRAAGEVADGNLPIFFSPDAPDVVTGPTLEGRKKVGKTMAGFDTAPYVRAKLGPDVAACRDQIRPELALYIGGMGARTKNFYNDMVSKMGFAGEAKVIQDLYLDGKKNEAAAAVPDALIDAISLVGPADRIRDRLQAWKAVAKDGHVGTMVLKGATTEVMRVVAEAVL